MYSLPHLILKSSFWTAGSSLFVPGAEPKDDVLIGFRFVAANSCEKGRIWISSVNIRVHKHRFWEGQCSADAVLLHWYTFSTANIKIFSIPFKLDMRFEQGCTSLIKGKIKDIEGVLVSQPYYVITPWGHAEASEWKESQFSSLITAH